MSLTVILVCLTGMIHSLVQNEIGKNLRKTLAQNRKCISIEDGELQIDEDFKFKSEQYYFCILNADGEIIEGKYPKGFSGNPGIEPFRRQWVTENGQKYVMLDTRKRLNGEEIYIRGVVKEKDVYKEYWQSFVIAVATLVAVFGMIVFLGVLLSKRITASLEYMCEKAETIGEWKDVSQRVEYDGPFLEMEVLADANNRMLDNIEELLRLQSQFSSDVAHELRTPVTVIGVECQYAKEQVNTVDEAEEVFQVIERQSTKMKELINQLLNLSRLEQGQQKIEKEKINLAEMVEYICEDMQQEEDGGILIETDLQTAEVAVDVNLCTIAVHNLISNAIKFSLGQERIRVKTGVKEERAYIAVQDFGIGIEAADIQNIFRRFYRVDASRNMKGYGLGLSLVKQIADVHRGTIEVESEPGKGSTFILWLPLQ